MTKAFINKVLMSCTFVDTRKYRYVVKEENFFGAFRRTVIRRINREKLGTLAAWDYDEWKTVWEGPWS